MILLTGATGLLGGHTLYALLQRYDRIAALKREKASLEGLREIFSFYTDDPDSLLERIEWRTGDMLDQESLIRALDGITCVVNCAAIVSFDPSKREELIRNNVEGSRNLANALLEVRRRRDAYMRLETKRRRDASMRLETIALIHISSTSALGDSPGNDPDFLVDEETPRNPERKHTGYSESKYQSEQLIRQSLGPSVSPSLGLQTHVCVSTSLGLFPTVFLNPGIILGPGQWGKGSSQLFVKAWEGLRFYTKGGTGYVDVRDVADVVVKMVEMVEMVEEVELVVDRRGGPMCPPAMGAGVPFGNRYCLVGANLFYRDFFNRVTDAFGKPNPSIYAGRFLSGLAWRMDTLRARLTGRNPLLTRETAESAQRISFFSSEKIKKDLGFEFRTIGETVGWVCGIYRTKGPRD